MLRMKWSKNRNLFIRNKVSGFPALIVRFLPGFLDSGMIFIRYRLYINTLIFCIFDALFAGGE
jgi:hypothetical protein